MAEIRVNSTGGVKLFDADDSHYAQIKAGTISSNTDVLELGSSAVVAGTKVDLNGQELILDADADTSITADTDDQIDVRIAGADDFQFTANTFTAQSGSSIVVPDGGLTFGSTAISSTAAELNILDGVTSTAAELNIVDGNTSATSTTIADADRVVLNDNGTMVQAAVTDLKTYIGGGTHVKLLGGTASSSVNHDFQNFMDATKYNTYLVNLTEISNGSGSNQRIDLNFIANTTVLSGSHYWGAVLGYRSGDTQAEDAYESGTTGKLGQKLILNDANRGNNRFHINVDTSRDFGVNVFGANWGYNSSWGDYMFTNYAIGYNSTATVTGIRLFESGGNATVFDYEIYGILK